MTPQPLVIFCFFLIFSIFASTCKERTPTKLKDSEFQNAADEEAWHNWLLDKFFGIVDRNDQRMTDWLGMSSNDVLNEVLADPKLGVFGLRFGLYRIAEYNTSIELQPLMLQLQNPDAPIYNYPQAIAFAQNLLDDQNFLDAYSMRVKLRKTSRLPVVSDQEVDGLTQAGFWDVYINNIRNLHRKQSAYLLRTYFCQDLTPSTELVALIQTSKAETQHARNPACLACHYKLDPMAGFLRNQNANGTPVTANEKTFADNKLMSVDGVKQHLSDNWSPVEDKQSKAWRVGFIRNFSGYLANQKSDTANVYGDRIDDLFHIIRTEPESYQCLVRNLAKYLFGQDQIFDFFWLDQMAEDLRKSSLGQPQKSSQALKLVLQKLALSKTATTPIKKRDVHTCYDRTDGDGAVIPCELNFYSRQYCQDCHNKNSVEGGLDVEKWMIDANGNGTFAMVDQKTKSPLKAKETFDRILDKLISKKMPKDVQMPGNEREKMINAFKKYSQDMR